MLEQACDLTINFLYVWDKNKTKNKNNSMLNICTFVEMYLSISSLPEFSFIQSIILCNSRMQWYLAKEIFNSHKSESAGRYSSCVECSQRTKSLLSFSLSVGSNIDKPCEKLQTWGLFESYPSHVTSYCSSKTCTPLKSILIFSLKHRFFLSHCCSVTWQYPKQVCVLYGK